MKRKKEIILSTLTILISLTSVVMTLNPAYTDHRLNPVIYSERRVKIAEDKKEAEKQLLASQPQSSGETSTASPIGGDASIIPTNSPVLQAINNYRNSIGLPALTEDGSLNASAQAHSQRMASGYGHNHSGYSGEVIGYGCPSVEAYFGHGIVQAWINSPGHNRILTGNYTSVGYGLVISGGCEWHTAWFK